MQFLRSLSNHQQGVVRACESAMCISVGRGYYAVNAILPLDAILSSPFMCVRITVFVTILVVMLWCSG